MFDIDGTLIESCDFDTDCFSEAVKTVTGVELNTDWDSYDNITDAGILDEFVTRHSLGEQREIIHKQVRQRFVELVSTHIALSPVHEIDGAVDFFQRLQTRTDIEVAIATGGWEETARMKLQSAGFDISGLAFASSSDAIQRATIMKTGESRCNHKAFDSKTYFGDGIWDKRACESLSYNFILVGKNFDYHKQVDNFKNMQQTMSYIGL